MIQIIECPRDAMQGIHEFIDTDTKVAYLNQLLKVGFAVLDCGSFVSPKYVPQMRDTAEVLDRLELDGTDTKLSVIVANERGAHDAAQFDQVSYMGFPFSISETFQVRNTNSTMAQALENVKRMKEISHNAGKEFVVYISMAFGNPYGDPWSVAVAEEWVAKMEQLDIKYLSMSDTVGVAQPDSISDIFSDLTARFPSIEFGAHFHTNERTWREKVVAAHQSNCKRFDGAIGGFGGCPMAKDELVGNMPTEHLVSYFDEVGESTGLNLEEFNKARAMVSSVFPS